MLICAQAFIRIIRLLQPRRVALVMCGLRHANHPIAEALKAVNCWPDLCVYDDMHITVVPKLNDALEFIENSYLRAFYAQPQSGSIPVIITPNIGKCSLRIARRPTLIRTDILQNSSDRASTPVSGSYSTSPRDRILKAAANSTLQESACLCDFELAGPSFPISSCNTHHEPSVATPSSPVDGC